MESRSDDNLNLDQDDSINSEIKTEPTTTNDNASLSNIKEVIPLMSEKLGVIKTGLVDEAIITKEPIKETKTEQILIQLFKTLEE